jgi:hypothetical protein
MEAIFSVIRIRYVDKSIFLYVFFLIFTISSVSYAAGSRDYISFSTAVFDVLQNDVPSIEGRLEYRANSIDWLLKPFAGFMANTDGGRYIYSGLFFEIPLAKFLSLIPSFAPGLYIKNFSKDLHSDLEFKSQIDAIFTLSGNLKAGLSFNHISNASLGKVNPGVESIAFTVQLPVPW